MTTPLHTHALSNDFSIRDCAFSIARLASHYRFACRMYRKRGVRAAARRVLSIASVYGRQALLGTVCRPAARFEFGGRDYRYFRHWHVTTFLNERTVEMPIVVSELQRHRPRRLLEVGNVLGHYVPTPHVVVDKYERAPGVLNVDAADYDTEDLFDMIISISTLEHIGWDEHPISPDKTIRVLENLQRLLAPAGRLVCTFPLGHNPHLDAHLSAGRLPFTNVRYLRRLNARNEWMEASEDDVADARYNVPFMHGNAVAVGLIEPSAPSSQRI